MKEEESLLRGRPAGDPHFDSVPEPSAGGKREGQQVGGQDKRAKVEREEKRPGGDDEVEGEEGRTKRVKLGQVKEAQGMRGGRVQVIGGGSNLI